MGPALDGGPLRYSVSLTQNPPRGLTGPKLRPSNSWWCLQIVLTFGDRPQPDCVASRHGRVMARPLGVLAPRHLLGVSPPPIYNPPSIEGQVAQLVEQRTEKPTAPKRPRRFVLRHWHSPTALDGIGRY